MHKKTLWVVIIGLTLLVGLAAKPASSQPKHEAFALREKTIQAAITQNRLFDCATYSPPTDPVLPKAQLIFQMLQDRKITPDDGREYLGAVWAPDGHALVFVAPTADYRTIPSGDTLPSDEQTRLVAVSKNALPLYSLAQDNWQLITADGMHPTWSLDGQQIYYMAGTALMKFDLNTKTSIPIGLNAPDTGVGLLLSWPLPDGRLLTAPRPHTPLEIVGEKASALRIGIADGDFAFPSPRGDHVVVAYGSNTKQGQFTPALTVLYHPNGEATPILKNCQFSAMELAWSPDSSRIAYPVHAERSEIRIYDVKTGQMQIIVRLAAHDLLSGLSWSPDGRYLAFTHGDDRSAPRSIWIVSTDGSMSQRLVEGGLLPHWSPNGKYILYARPANDRLLDWYLLEIMPIQKQEDEDE
ncbi:MAG: hypothetical protein ACK4WM_07975 [Thermoflexales bacterium]